MSSEAAWTYPREFPGLNGSSGRRFVPARVPYWGRECIRYHAYYVLYAQAQVRDFLSRKVGSSLV